MIKTIKDLLSEHYGIKWPAPNPAAQIQEAPNPMLCLPPRKRDFVQGISMMKCEDALGRHAERSFSIGNLPSQGQSRWQGSVSQ